MKNRIHPGRVPPALFSRTRHKNRIGVKTRNGEYSVNGIRLLSSNDPYCSADGCRSAVRKPLYQSGANRQPRPDVVGRLECLRLRRSAHLELPLQLCASSSAKAIRGMEEYFLFRVILTTATRRLPGGLSSTNCLATCKPVMGWSDRKSVV